MKFTKLFAAAALSMALVTGCASQKGIISINGEVIKKGVYDEMYNDLISGPQGMMLGEQVKEPDSLYNLMIKERLTNEIIVKTLLKQEVEKRGIKATDADIDAKVAEIEKQVGGADALKESLKANNITMAKLRKDLVQEIQIDKLVSELGNFDVDEKDVKAYYEKNKAKFKVNERVRASHILIEADAKKIKQAIIDEDKEGKLNAEQIEAKVKAKMAELKAKTNELREALIKNPKDFARLATTHSQDTGSAKKGGDLGFFEKGQMVKPFEVVAFKIQPNKISEIVETPYGYHIIMVTDRAKAGIMPFSEVKNEIQASMVQEKKIATLQKLFEGLKSEAKIEYLDQSFNPETLQAQIKEKIQVKKQSQDAGAALQEQAGQKE